MATSKTRTMCELCGDYPVGAETNGIKHCLWESCEQEAAAAAPAPRPSAVKACSGIGAKPHADERGDLAVCPGCRTFQSVGAESGRFVPHTPGETDALAYDI